ncbi:MAG TPA: hypothetical protein P5048_02880, partial [Chlamydiales bacterium]|nr:hypothetical protein [Chlamydiales bacterium]
MAFQTDFTQKRLAYFLDCACFVYQRQGESRVIEKKILLESGIRRIFLDNVGQKEEKSQSSIESDKQIVVSNEDEKEKKNSLIHLIHKFVLSILKVMVSGKDLKTRTEMQQERTEWQDLKIRLIDEYTLLENEEKGIVENISSDEERENQLEEIKERLNLVSEMST